MVQGLRPRPIKKSDVNQAPVFDKNEQEREEEECLEESQPDSAEEDEDEYYEEEGYQPETLQYEPEKINITVWQPTIFQVLRRIDRGILDLESEFQRSGDIWNIGAQSRLIESVMIRIPLPAFYIDVTDEDHWLVVDGLQRLTTLKKFCDNKFKLTELEYLKELEGKTFDELDIIYQSRLEDSQLTVYRIEKGTPRQVRYNIFYRINTGGEPLNPQEIRHTLNPGAAPQLLKELASVDWFKKIMKPSEYQIKRMEDREVVLRFLAFKLTPYNEYNGRINNFLDETMSKLNKLYERDRGSFEGLRVEFEEGMKAALDIFGTSALRKTTKNKTNELNRVLFEVWTVSLSNLDSQELEILRQRKDELLVKFRVLLKNSQFVNSISWDLRSVVLVRYRFQKIEKLIREVLR